MFESGKQNRDGVKKRRVTGLSEGPSAVVAATRPSPGRKASPLKSTAGGHVLLLVLCLASSI